MKNTNQVLEWNTGSDKKDPNGDFEDEYVGGLQYSARVIYLRSLGYTISNWQQYAWAEINELPVS